MTKSGFSKLDNPNHQGQTDTWFTPQYIIDALGEFDFDPCPGPKPRPNKTANFVCEGDGLMSEWKGRVWLNPPYGKSVGAWLNKLQDHGNGIALVFARTDTKWFQSLNPELVFMIASRLKFIRQDGSKDTNAGHGSMLLAFGRKNVAAILNSDLDGRWFK